MTRCASPQSTRFQHRCIRFVLLAGVLMLTMVGCDVYCVCSRQVTVKQAQFLSAWKPVDAAMKRYRQDVGDYPMGLELLERGGYLRLPSNEELGVVEYRYRWAPGQTAYSIRIVVARNNRGAQCLLSCGFIPDVEPSCDLISLQRNFILSCDA